jgi:uncharacterized protein (TIGR04255 family)
MPFPEKSRVIFRNNPLEQVICQLRFPPILKIDAEIPADFQERIRHQFPIFSESTELSVGQFEKDTPTPPEIFQNMIKPSEIKNYAFSSEDKIWRINLTRTFIALTSKKYERWEQFKEKLTIPLKALFDIYTPSYFTRIGLRYVDVIKRKELGLEGVSWRDLLNPYLLGMLGSEEIGDFVENFENTYEMSLSDKKSFARINTKFVKAKDSGEVCYVIDTDFFNSHKTSIDDAFKKLDYFTIRGSRLIQWCISDQLFEAMGPEKI